MKPAPTRAAGGQPLVMGILNVTPDSFSDGGRFVDVDAAMARARQMVDDGVDVIDVGGESTRPGAAPVDEATELDRVLPVLEAIRELGVRLSIDTTKAAVAEAAVAAGASLVNDVSASLEAVAGRLGVGWVALHRQGDARTMQLAPAYHDVVREVSGFLAAAADRGVQAGVREIWLDPGIGFGKTTAHNLALLGRLDEIVALGHPVCVGVSRKRFLGELVAASDGAATSRSAGSSPGARFRGTLVDVDDRREGSLAAATAAFAAGAAMVRVHDVRMTVQARRVVAATV